MIFGSEWLLVAAVAFVGTHFIMSHPLRRSLVGAMGERGFSAFYSAVALVTFGMMIVAYRAVPLAAPLWSVGDGLWALSTLVMLIASVLFVGSLIKNPTLAGGLTSASNAQARGVYGITRHPMMWSFALWGMCHILVFPVEKNIILAGAIIVLALVGASFQDRKKSSIDPEGWLAWMRQTSYFPFVAIAERRATFGNFRPHALLGGLLVWLLATWAHLPLSGWPAGIWRWVHL